MTKKSSRSIPYRVYKKMFSDCNAYDYCNGKITVDFPEDYLADKIFVPEGWSSGSNWVSSCMNDDYIYINISWHSDGGVRYYDAYVMRGN